MLHGQLPSTQPAPLVFWESEIKFSKSARKSSAVAANSMITRLFAENHLEQSLKQLKTIAVMVVCAGDFPGFVAFTNALLRSCPALKNIKYVLVDPSSHGAKLFLQHFYPEEANLLSRPVAIEFKLEEATFADYLASHHDKFGLVYFEHPYVNVLQQFYDGARYSSRSSMILSTLPHLAKNLEPNAVVMAVCKTAAEQTQMRVALSYSLTMPAKTLTASMIGPEFPEDFSTAVTGQYKPAMFKQGLSPAAKEKQIFRNQQSLFVLASLSFCLFLYAVRNGEVRSDAAASMFAIFAHLMLHFPGQGMGVKVAIVTLQVMALASAAMEPAQNTKTLGPR